MGNRLVCWQFDIDKRGLWRFTDIDLSPSPSSVFLGLFLC